MTKRGMKMEESESHSPSSLLFCPEDKLSCLNQDDEDIGKMGNYPFLINSPKLPSCHFEYQEDDNDDDYIKLLVHKEIMINDRPNCSTSPSSYPSWLRIARLDAINWILNAQTLLGFRNQTAYLSVTYFDRFLSIRYIDEGKLWTMKLLSIACLSLAAKMEECQIPPLSEYPIEEHYGFGCKVIQKMELLVLTTMEWKINLITPFVYIHYLIKKLGMHEGDTVNALIFRAKDLVMAFIKEIDSIEHRPSVIAAAAVLAASDWQLTQETLSCKMSTVPLWQTSENEEELFGCYRLMRRLSSKGDLCTPNLTAQSIASPKRRLTFSDRDQNPNLSEKINRH